MSIDPLVSHRIIYCNICVKKPAQDIYKITTLDRRIMFCSMKCMQSYKYLEMQKVKQLEGKK